MEILAQIALFHADIVIVKNTFFSPCFWYVNKQSFWTVVMIMTGFPPRVEEKTKEGGSSPLSPCARSPSISLFRIPHILRIWLQKPFRSEVFKRAGKRNHRLNVTHFHWNLHWPCTLHAPLGGPGPATRWAGLSLQSSSRQRNGWGHTAKKIFYLKYNRRGKVLLMPNF